MGGYTIHLKRLAADEKRTINPSTISFSGDFHTRFAAVSEAGLYKLIMRSDKPVAKPFQDWVTREVLPSIRKTGGYRLSEGETIPLPAPSP